MSVYAFVDRYDGFSTVRRGSYTQMRYDFVYLFLTVSFFERTHLIRIYRQAGGLEVTAFPVLHGEDYVSHGFLFGPEGNKICYISDVR